MPTWQQKYTAWNELSVFIILQLLVVTVMQNMQGGGSNSAIAGSHQGESKSLCFGLTAKYANVIIHLQKFILGLKTII